MDSARTIDSRMRKMAVSNDVRIHGLFKYRQMSFKDSSKRQLLCVDIHFYNLDFQNLSTLIYVL